MAFFTKDEILQRVQEKRAQFEFNKTLPAPRADMNLALMILGSALFDQRLKSGRDYGEHPVHVGMSNTRSNTKRIIGILHDVVEDSEWTVDDLRAVGFSERIVSAVDAMTHREGELYFDSIERCSRNRDALDKKIEDLSHNMDMSRTENFVREKDVERTNKYVIARAYLVAIKKGYIDAGSSIADFVANRADLSANPLAAQLVDKYRSKPAATAAPAAPKL